MHHTFQGEVADVRQAIRKPWVPLLWLILVIWAQMLWGAPQSLYAGVFALFLVLVVAIDMATFTIPNLLTLPLALLGLLVADDYVAALLGLCVGYFVFELVAVGGRVLLKRDGLGQGDVKLFAAMGAWVGASGLPLVALVGSLAALAYIMLAHHPKRALLPFGPFLALGGWLVLLYQMDIWQVLLTHAAVF